MHNSYKNGYMYVIGTTIHNRDKKVRTVPLTFIPHMGQSSNRSAQGRHKLKHPQGMNVIAPS